MGQTLYTVGWAKSFKPVKRCEPTTRCETVIEVTLLLECSI